MSTIYTYHHGSIIPLTETITDECMASLIASEFKNISPAPSDKTIRLIETYGFGWDPLSHSGYLTFKPYATFLIEAVRLQLWKNVQRFCLENNIPLQRIAGGDLYALDKELMKKHVHSAEKVGMYGDALLRVSGNQVLRFSGCSNKLSQLAEMNLDNVEFPFGIFEISNSYRYEKEEELNYLLRNRHFQLPELHIVNKSLIDGLNYLLRAHNNICNSMEKESLDYIMLFSTTRSFLSNNMCFIDEICKRCKHNPIINVFDDNTCENGIVFDVEYKAKMTNGLLVEIATLQIDEGNTDFSYGILYQNKPVITVHAVFFASSVERTIFTYCDKVANSTDVHMPLWLAPIQCRILPVCIEDQDVLTDKLSGKIRFEIDDRDTSFQNKFEDAIHHKIPYILKVGKEITEYQWRTNEFKTANINQILSFCNSTDSQRLGQFSPISLKKRVLF